MQTRSASSLRKYISENKHLLLLLYIPVYLAVFAFLNSGMERGYRIIEIPLDRMIPYCEWFIIPYVTWYVYLFGPPLYLLIKKDIPEFKRFMYMMIITFSISLLMFAVFPSGQSLRPTQVPDNFAGFLCSLIYAADPPYNVLPSMHVIGTLFACASILRTKTVKSKLFKIFFAVTGVLIILSTAFIKQHSLIDIFSGIILFILTDLILTYKGKRLYTENCRK